MKNALRFFLISFLLLGFNACTWTSKKDLALDVAKKKIETDLLLESKSALEQKPLFHKKYASTILSKTDFSVLKETENSDGITLQIKVMIVPIAARQSLQEIFAKQNEKRETNFNGSDALALIYKQLSISPESNTEQILTVLLKKKEKWEVSSIK